MFRFDACTKENRCKTYFTCADALLFIVKFSANDANELSKSPVSTFPVLDGCCVVCWAPPVPIIFPVWIGPAAVAETGPGFNTAPNASKPISPQVLC